MVQLYRVASTAPDGEITLTFLQAESVEAAAARFFREADWGDRTELQAHVYDDANDAVWAYKSTRSLG